jgi:hypothetical protein
MHPVTRDQLLLTNAPELMENYKRVEQSLPEIYQHVLQASRTTTSYTYHLRIQRWGAHEGISMPAYIDRLMYRLKELFPNSKVDYIESKSAINGNIIERAVRIDWS